MSRPGRSNATTTDRPMTSKPNIEIVRINDKSICFKFSNGLLSVTLRQGDLCAEQCDALVNTTNSSMKPTGGLDEIMHRKFGAFFSQQVEAACDGMGDDACPIGQSRIFVAKAKRDVNTARFVINTVGPMYKPEEKETAAFHLQSCYSSSLALANQYSLRSIAYPAISCGAYLFPPEEAAEIAIESIRNYTYNVKDVRIVIFDSNMFRVFYRVWEEYVKKVNQTSATPSGTSGRPVQGRAAVKSERPDSAPLSSRYCILCQEQPLPTNAKDLCINCSKLKRHEFFELILQRFSCSAEKSFENLESDCKSLKPLLVYYPLSYTPLKKFDLLSHQRDSAAEYYLQSHCAKEYRRWMPIAIVGDGNCLYNTFIKLGGGGSTAEDAALTPIELRARNIIELVLRKDAYKSAYPELGVICDEAKKYICEEMVRDTNDTCIWDILSLPTVLNVNILTVYPHINGKDNDTYHALINGKIFKPLSCEQSGSRAALVAAPTDREVRLLFSHSNKPVQIGGKTNTWIPNHFVPLLNLR